jgi:hypothetical protein
MVRIVDWSVEEHRECTDYVTGISHGKKVVEGEFSINSKIGRFRIERYWEHGNSGESIKILNESDFTGEEIDSVICELESKIEELLR